MKLSWKEYIMVSLSTETQSSTSVFNINNYNNYSFLNAKSLYYIISGGTCDTEDWSNDDENSAIFASQEYIIS